MSNKTHVHITIEIEGDEGAEGLQASLRDALNALSGAVARAPSTPEAAETSAGSNTDTETGRRRRGRPRRAAAPPRQERKRRVPRGQGVTATVRNLVGTGYFDNSRSASEVIHTLSDEGQLTDSKQVYAALKYLTERNMLAREADGENYRYRTTNGGGAGQAETTEEQEQ